MASDPAGNLHESASVVGPVALDTHRALQSLKEELEAVDWYHQRAHATNDSELRRILAHHRDEEIEHACMIIEWLRRHMPVFDAHMRTYLFTELAIVDVEKASEDGATHAARATGANAQPGSLGLHARLQSRS